MNRRTWIASVGASLIAARLRDGGNREVVSAYAGQPDLRVLNASAPLPVALSFQWKSESVANALMASAASKRHLLANESVVELTVKGTAGGQSTLLLHKATAQDRLHDPARNAYMTSPVPGDELERLLAAGTRATFTVDLTFTLSSFFDVLLAHMTRTDDDMHNVANPIDSNAILKTFEREKRDGEVNVVYESETHSIKAVPCKLVDISVSAQPRPRLPAVELRFEIDFLTGIDTVRREAMRKLVAMDWSRLAHFGEAAPMPSHGSIWIDNVLGFLARQTDMRRAERIRTSIASKHATKNPRQLANDLRKDIDLLLITANHWGEAREDLKTERHQALLSDLLGTFHKTDSPASPMTFSRDLAAIYGLSLDERAAMTLQYGTGYCGEHSRTSFSILRTIMSTPGNQLDSIVLTGNANIDHAFVLCNLQVTRVIFTRATSPTNTRVAIGEDIKVFDLRDALAEAPGREVLVIDPYLDMSMISPTADGLLDSLNSKKKRKRGKDTDFLIFQLQHPVPSDFAIEDIRDSSVTERMARVRNV